MSTDDLLVRRERSEDSQSSSVSIPVTPTIGGAAPAPSVSTSSLDRLRNTFRRTESISSQIFSHISTQFSNAAAAAASSEVIDGTTTYPYPDEPAPPVVPVAQTRWRAPMLHPRRHRN
ncbi:GD15130 [Drosophila simulans]|uniref:GD15130 n=1 Tax=Drosophila simulans TaxID=7240 RepID=B4NT72_DROSI|nr:GD15130 [Drosophila simulans]